MKEKDKLKYRHRFSGYQLPKIQLDETGHTYYYIKGVHPYYTSQPLYWQKPFFETSTPAIGNRGNSSNPGSPSVNTVSKSSKGGNKLHGMMKFS